VRDEFEATQYVELLEKLAATAAGAPQAADTLPLVLAVVQHLASPQHHPLPQRHIFVPDRTGVLAPSHELMFDDAPWLGDAALMGSQGTPALTLPPAAAQWRRVHLNVSHDVAERLGAQSLRRWLISRNADTLSLGQDNIEAFGQHESLTSRLHNILELYADGVGILHELIQNADDAGATKVAFLLDESSHGDSSLLSPMMRAWQGPALYAYNDSTFKPHDFRNICAIGSNAKLAVSPGATKLSKHNRR
jgi:sacsin